jgi:ADP-L-glycero-D-manno-heptose 6-epimerase
MKSFQDQLIVITGGAGFIGSGTIRYLNNLGLNNLVIVDDLGHGEKWKNLVGKQFIDIVPKTQLSTWLEGRSSEIKAFIHLGACSDTTEKDANYLLENNYRYSVRLAEYALTHQKRFIYASSAATYGDGSQGFVDKIPSIHDLHPLNMYGFSKQLFDQWVDSQGVAGQVVGLKYFNVFGPNEGHKGRMASPITRMVPQILRGETVKLFKSNDPKKFKDGEQQRDFVYVKDVVRMTCEFLTQDRGGLYNIGSGVALSWNRLVETVFHVLNKPVQIEYIEMPADLKNKYQNYSRADMRQTETILKEAASSRPFAEAVKDYILNYIIPEKLW